MTAERQGRKVFKTRETPFQDYDLDGPVQPEMSLLPLSYRRDGPAAPEGCYMMRMEAGAVTIAHEHTNMEEFMVLEGSLTDDDGAVFGPGDHVCYEPGTRHNSWTEDGCLLIVFEWKRGG